MIILYGEIPLGLEDAAAMDFFPSSTELCLPKPNSFHSCPLTTFSSKSLVFVPFVRSVKEKKVKAVSKNYRIGSNVYNIGIYLLPHTVL